MVPLGNAAFALPLKHVKGLNQKIEPFDIIGLGVCTLSSVSLYFYSHQMQFILMGLVLYRFMPLIRELLGLKEPEKKEAIQMPVRAFNRNTMEVLESLLSAEPLLRRNDVQIRRSYFDKLGIAGRAPVGAINSV